MAKPLRGLSLKNSVFRARDAAALGRFSESESKLRLRLEVLFGTPACTVIRLALQSCENYSAIVKLGTRYDCCNGSTS